MTDRQTQCIYKFGDFHIETHERLLKRNGEVIQVEITVSPLDFQGRDARLVLVTDVSGPNVYCVRPESPALSAGPAAGSSSTTGSAFDVRTTGWAAGRAVIPSGALAIKLEFTIAEVARATQ